MKRIAIMGTGQLAQMMAKASQQADPKLEVSFVFVAEPGDSVVCVEGLGDIIVYNPEWSVAEFFEAMGRPEVVTVEKEAVSVSLLESLSSLCLVAPGAKAVGITQNRSAEKSFLREHGVPSVAFASSQTASELHDIMQSMAFPVIIKSAESGYDGKHQWRIRSSDEFEDFFSQYQDNPLPVVVEQWVDYTAEISMLAVRSSKGQLAFYPLTFNKHKNGILLSSRAPVSQQLRAYEAVAKKYLEKLVTVLDYVGVLAMECFVVDGQLLVNELAPRVHNSGHWTQNGSHTSQFENHIRAISGLPLGSTDLKGESAMLNLLGLDQDQISVTDPESQLYWYGKACKPGRKMGHINICHQEAAVVDNQLAALEKLNYPD